MLPYSKLRKDVVKFIGKPEILKTYVYLLINSKYKPEYYERGDFIVGRDQIVKSIDCLVKELGLSVARVRHALEYLETNGFILIDRSRKFNVITVLTEDTPQKPCCPFTIDL